jgi:hypothetical protein
VSRVSREFSLRPSTGVSRNRRPHAGPSSSRQRDWKTNQLPTLQPRLLMSSKNFTGSSAASIDESDATMDTLKSLGNRSAVQRVALGLAEGVEQRRTAEDGVIGLEVVPGRDS